MARRDEIVCAGLVFCGYAAWAQGGVGWMDAGEFAASAFSLGSAHPPGHPLQIWLSHGAARLPVGEVAFRTNLFSAAAMAAAAVAVLRLARPARQQRVLAALVLLASFATPVVVENAVRTEVYAITTALLLWAWALSPTGERRAQGGAWVRAAILYGLAATCHPLMALAFVGGALVAAGPALAAQPRCVLGWGAAAFVFPGFTFLGLIVRAHAQAPPAWMWGDPGSAAGLWKLLSAASYHGNFAWNGVFERAVGLVARLLDGSGAAILVVGCLGWVHGRGCARVARLWLPATAVVAVAALQSAHNPDMAGYLLPAYLAFVVGVVRLVGTVEARNPFAWVPPAWGRAAAAVAVAVVLFAGLWWRPAPLRAGAGPWEHAAETVALLPPGPAVHVVDSDPELFTAIYLRVVAGMRPDVVVVSAEMLRDEWFVRSVDRQLPSLRVPFVDDGQRGEIAQRLLAYNLPRGVGFSAADPQWRPLAALQVIPWGRTYRATQTDEGGARAAPTRPPPRYIGAEGQRVARRIALRRAAFELAHGRTVDAVRAAGIEAWVQPCSESALQAADRSQLIGRIPTKTYVFLAEPWQTALLADEIAWRCDTPSATPTPVVWERKLHRVLRALRSRSRHPLPDSLALDEAHKSALLALGEDAVLVAVGMLEEAQAFADAEALLRDAIDLGAGGARSLLRLAQEVGARGPERYREALALLEVATRLEPDDVRAWIGVGQMAAVLGDPERAAAAFERVLALEPGHPQALAGLQRIKAR